jgi:flagellar protein FlgJ
MPRGATPAARDFIDRLWPHAQAASQASGIPAPFLLAQAALETGWGRAELQHADGRPSYNVFGIKAGKSWNGPVVEATTTEYVDGVPQQRIERFRAYASYGEAFQDYLRLLAGNSRYGAVMGAGNAREFALGLQRAGYATDPNYADKLTRIIGGLTPAAA